MCSVSNGAIETLSVEWISRIDLKPTQPQGIIAHFLSLALFFPFLMKQISFLFSPKTDHLLLLSRHLKAFLNHPDFTGEPGKLQSTMHMSTHTLWHRDSLINTTGTSFMLGVYAWVCLTFYYIISELIWSFLCGLLFLAEAVCQLHTLSVGIGMIDIRVWLCSQWLFCWFCGTFLNIIIVFCVQTKEYRFAFCLLVFQNQLWDWGCWCRGVGGLKCFLNTTSLWLHISFGMNGVRKKTNNSLHQCWPCLFDE